MKKLFVSIFSAMMVVLLLLPVPAPTQSTVADWKPSRPISLVVGHGPGGGFDLWGRAVARALTKHVGVPVVVDNVPGLGGVTAMETLWRTEPDGYTIKIFELSSMIIAQYLTKAKYDVHKFTPIGVAHVAARNLWAAKASPFNSIQDVVKAGKTRTLRGGTTGLSSGLWQTVAIFANEAGIDVKPVAGYKSGAELFAALEAGDFDILVQTTSATLSFLRERGSLKPLALGGFSHDPRLPGVPTLAEAGFPRTGAFARCIRALVAPPGTPSAAAGFLEKSLMDALSDPEFLKWVESLEEIVEPLNAQQMSDLVKDTDKLVQDFLPVLRQYMK